MGKPFVVLQSHPDFDRRRNGDQTVQLAGLVPGRWYTGLQVANAPGVPLIWVASVLLSLGTALSFFTSHRRLLDCLEGGRLTVAGPTTKNPDTFGKLHVELTLALRHATENPRADQRARG